MILIDYSQVIISNLMAHIGANNADEPFDENLIRHMVLNSLRGYRNKFYAEYGELIICCDSKNPWRRDVFPYYKANRKKDREASVHNWASIFDVIGKIKEEIRENLPYKVLEVERAEADDIIGTICLNYGSYVADSFTEKILIISGDKDFTQLQKYINVYQWAPIQKKFITTDNPERFLREHIILGDKGDGVPNVLSDDDTFVEGKRQQPISRRKMDEWITNRSLNNTRGYKRNETLINLDMIPKDIQEAIVFQLEFATTGSRAHLLEYFMKNKLKLLTNHIQDF